MKLREHFFQTGGSVVVQKALAMTDAPQRRRIELAQATLIGEADIVRFVRGVRQRRNMAADTSPVLEQLAAALELLSVRGLGGGRLQRWRRWQGVQKRYQIGHLVGGRRG